LLIELVKFVKLIVIEFVDKLVEFFEHVFLQLFVIELVKLVQFQLFKFIIKLQLVEFIIKFQLIELVQFQFQLIEFNFWPAGIILGIARQDGRRCDYRCRR
jgi:hypothetical protein